MAKRQIFQFFLDPVQADPLGQRGIYLNRFTGDTLTLFRFADMMKRAHIMNPVGQFDQQNADILGHGQNQLTEIFSLFALRRLAFDPR